MLDLEEITYTYATISCDWPYCTNRISLSPGPEDMGREAKDLQTVRSLASARGWIIRDRGRNTECPYHNQKETK